MQRLGRAFGCREAWGTLVNKRISLHLNLSVFLPRLWRNPTGIHGCWSLWKTRLENVSGLTDSQECCSHEMANKAVNNVISLVKHALFSGTIEVEAMTCPSQNSFDYGDVLVQVCSPCMSCSRCVQAIPHDEALIRLWTQCRRAMDQGVTVIKWSYANTVLFGCDCHGMFPSAKNIPFVPSRLFCFRIIFLL